MLTWIKKLLGIKSPKPKEPPTYRIVEDTAFVWKNTFYGTRYFVEQLETTWNTWQPVEEARPRYTPPGWPTLDQAKQVIKDLRKEETKEVRTVYLDGP